MMIAGIDLSGPTNSMDTCLVYFQAHYLTKSREGENKK